MLLDTMIPNCLSLVTSLNYPLTLSDLVRVINTKQFGEHDSKAYFPIEICLTCLRFKLKDYLLSDLAITEGKTHISGLIV